MNVIQVDGLTKDYGHGKGIFQLGFTMKKGEVTGFLGPNGAGKTTTIRHLMGFLRPDAGSAYINGMHCCDQASQIQKMLGYLPGEIAFMEDMTGIGFLQFMAGMKKMQSFDYARSLMHTFDLDASGKIKKMSKGMKQKIGIVCAFMHDPEILLLDEPTSGLDPLMQNQFAKLIVREQQRNKTILLSSHSFEEVEQTCGRVIILKNGRIVASETMEQLRAKKHRAYTVCFVSEQDAAAFSGQMKNSHREANRVTVSVHGNIDSFLKAAAMYPVTDLQVEVQSLEQLFLQFYGGRQA